MKLSKIAEILNIELNGADAEITAINSLQNASEFSDTLRAVSAEPSICAAPIAAKFYAVCNRH